MNELEPEIAHLQKLQAKHRKNIHTLEETLANYGMARPLSLLNELDYGREQLRQVEERLARLAAHAGREEVPTAPVEPARPPRQVPSRVTAPEPEMVLIPAGEFLMGSDPSVDRYAQDNEQPQHSLYLPDYYMAKTPVTNVQYAAFVRATGHDPPTYGADRVKKFFNELLWESGNPPRGREDHPVTNVSLHDAVAYCNWLAEVTGKLYLLPSEAEWEKGARGSDGYIYPWGNLWDAKRCNSRKSGKGDTTPVGAYPAGASPYGLLDMAGNVWEYTRSSLRKYPYHLTDGREDPKAKGLNGLFPAMRGGAFSSDERKVRCACRIMYNQITRHDANGFRVVLSPASPLDSGGSKE